MNPMIRSPIENANERRARPMMARASGVISGGGVLVSVMPDNVDEDEEFALVVDPADAGGRLDAVLARAFPAFSRSRVKDLIGLGAVSINGQEAKEPAR